ncbi:MAG TPA: hypothetical protein VFT67_15135 [Jatrophihabitantaceae bacterium]|jgi:hypothetical protein|nr:hypothetical protein [Jatrophihabitantaceae bacterium]
MLDFGADQFHPPMLSPAPSDFAGGLIRSGGPVSPFGSFLIFSPASLAFPAAGERSPRSFALPGESVQMPGGTVQSKSQHLKTDL